MVLWLARKEEESITGVVCRAGVGLISKANTGGGVSFLGVFVFGGSLFVVYLEEDNPLANLLGIIAPDHR